MLLWRQEEISRGSIVMPTSEEYEVEVLILITDFEPMSVEKIHEAWRVFCGGVISSATLCQTLQRLLDKEDIVVDGDFYWTTEKGARRAEEAVID